MKHGVTNGSGSSARRSSVSEDARSPFDEARLSFPRFLPLRGKTFVGRTVRRSRLPRPRSSRSAETSRAARSARRDSSCLSARSSGSSPPRVSSSSSGSVVRPTASSSSSSFSRWTRPSPTPPRYPSPSSPSASTGRFSRSSRRSISESLNSHFAFTFFSRNAALFAASADVAAARVTILRAPCISTLASSAARDTDPCFVNRRLSSPISALFALSSGTSDSSRPRFTTSRSTARLLLASSTMRSSTVAAVTSWYTTTSFLCPMRCARLCACSSTNGLKSGSYMITVSAVARFSPRPPARVLTNIKNVTLSSELKLSITR
mmetsp:Transcript_12020/g.51617  ORF Transcript_12020/g.51617 Transcript_12020/m.51617 type:complete len:320 (-) Transcript_12020:536-1495(-)